MGYQGPKGARRAGLLGEGLLSIDPALVEPYRTGLADGGHDPDAARMAGGIQGWVSDDPEADWPLVARHLAHQVDSYRRHMVEGTDQPTPRPIDPDRLRQRDFGGPLSYFLYGTPEEVAARLRAHVGDAPVETVFFWASLSGMPEEIGRPPRPDDLHPPRAAARRGTIDDRAVRDLVDAADVGIDPARLDVFLRRARLEVEHGPLPSAQVAVARGGRLVAFETVRRRHARVALHPAVGREDGRRRRGVEAARRGSSSGSTSGSPTSSPSSPPTARRW